MVSQGAAILIAVVMVTAAMAAPPAKVPAEITTGKAKDKTEDSAPQIEDAEKNDIMENENCTGKHRPHPTDATKFETYFTGMWIEQPCPGLNLVWDQFQCRCDYPPRHVPGDPCEDRRSVNPEKGKYKQLLNGKWYARDCNLGASGMVWNQSECNCIPNSPTRKLGGSPCDVMLNISFSDETVMDHAKGAWIQRPWDSRIVIRKVAGAIGNWAAHIRDSSLRVFYFAGNAWSDMMQVFISFRADKDPKVEDKFQMLLSNGCNYTWIGYFSPSVGISYRAKDGTLKIQFQTYEAKTLSCSIISDYNGWHSVALLYQDGILQLVVDGYLCLASRDFSGPVKVNQCPLTVAGDPLRKEASFRGYLDELLITRYCKL